MAMAPATAEVGTSTAEVGVAVAAMARVTAGVAEVVAQGAVQATVGVKGLVAAPASGMAQVQDDTEPLGCL
jgi:hypothetical protein